MQPRTAREIAERRSEVLRLIGSMRPQVRAAGFDSAEDLAQEVLCRILRYEHDRMGSAFDPRRAAWTTYVVRVTRSLLRERMRMHAFRAAAFEAMVRGGIN